jgi:DNA adenine methylase
MSVAYVGEVRSPLAWIGGKYYSAERILEAFPPANRYDVYVEPFGGAAHVLARKSPAHHLEIYNDRNRDLVNWWRWMRDHPEKLEARLDTLPYSRALYQDYHASLFDGSPLDSLERAVRWYYVLRSSFSATVRPRKTGWNNAIRHQSAGPVHTFRHATELFRVVAARFRYVQLECRDFAAVIEQYQGLRTLLYVDPPYLGCENYYQGPDGKRFTWGDHERLATLLNATPSLVALSYYDHSQLEEWYPAPRWRRLQWETVKHSQRTRAQRDKGHEVLLCNYPAPVSLWEVEA